MNAIMLLPKNVAFILSVLGAHLLFTKLKNMLLDDLQAWWHEFVGLATNFLSEDEINQRFSYVKGRPSLPFMKMNKNAFHEFTSQVTRGSLILSPELYAE